MADTIRIEPIELAERWRNEHGTFYGLCFEHFHSLSAKVLDVRTAIGDVFQSAFFEVCNLDNVDRISLRGVTLTQAMSEALQSAVGSKDVAWSALTDQEKILACSRLGLNPAGVLTVESPADGETVGSGNFWSRRSGKRFIRHLQGAIENQKLFNAPIIVAGKFNDVEDSIESVALQIEIASDAIACLQAEGGFPYSIQTGQRLSANLTSLLDSTAEVETTLVPFYDSYFGWMETVQRLNLWLVYKDRTLKPRPVLTTPHQNFVDELARAGGQMMTTKLKQIFTNLSRDRTLESLEKDKVIEWAHRKGVWLTELGWRCTTIERPLSR